MVVLVAVLMSVAASSCGSSSRHTPSRGAARLTLHSCVGLAARCGTFVVAENRAKPNGRTIALRVIVLPAAAKPVASDAVTFIAGGPGHAVSEQVYGLSTELLGLNEHRDILLVDQRGTGSGAHYCPDRTKPFRSTAELRAFVERCLKAFGGDASQYGTRAAMDDLDAVRAALGYRQLDVIGESYGATAAQVYARLHPASVRTLMLDGATALDVPLFSHYAVNAQRALDQLATLCDSDAACRKAFPIWERQFGELVKAWSAHPVKTGKGGPMTGDQLAGVVHAMLLDTQKAVSIPLVVSRAAKGDYAPLNQHGPGDLLSIKQPVMAWSINCSEPWVGLDAKPPWGTEFDSFTVTMIAEFRQGCMFFPKRSEPRALWTFSTTSHVPVLVFEGGADPQDPATNLSDLAQHFPDSRIVILPHIGHEFSIGGCVDQIMADFVDRGTTRGLDTTRCAGQIPVPPFPLTG